LCYSLVLLQHKQQAETIECQPEGKNQPVCHLPKLLISITLYFLQHKTLYENEQLLYGFTGSKTGQ